MADADVIAKLQEYAGRLSALLAQAERDVAATGTLAGATRDRVREFVSLLTDELSVLYAESAAGRLGPLERDHLLPVVQEMRAVLRGAAGFREPGSAVSRLRTAVSALRRSPAAGG